MKKTLLLILSISGLACFLNLSTANANIYDQFSSVSTYNIMRSVPIDQNDIAAGKVYHIFTDGSNDALGQPTDNEFKLFPSPNLNPDNAQGGPDDGYVLVPLGFSYRYNGVVYTSVYVSVNGFVTFDTPPSLPEIARPSGSLFINDNGQSLPQNAVAPYWGDHKYWRNNQANIDAGYAPSQISYLQSTYQTAYNNNPVTKNCVVIEWKDINVNWRTITGTTPGPYDTANWRGNVATFQLIIYEGPDDVVAQQGNMEFRYDQYGIRAVQYHSPAYGLGNVLLNPYNAASLGCKGTERYHNNQSDYINALYNGYAVAGAAPVHPADPWSQRNYDSLTREFPPVGAGSAITLNSSYSINGDNNWGDGDADMSKAEGGRHEDNKNIQNIYVTINDVRTIMRSIVTGVKLDSLLGKAAFHGDVHHDGRYYYLSSSNVSIYPMDRTTKLIVRSGGNPADWSRDTFFIGQINTTHTGDFGFLPYFGDNANYMAIDFRNIPGEALQGAIRNIRLVDPGNNTRSDFYDYEMRLYAQTPADRDILWKVLDYRNEVNRINFRLKKNVIWRNELLHQGIPWIVSPTTDIFYQADEKDAAFILSYLGGKIPGLPWIYENPIHNGKGKVTTPFRTADNISMQDAVVDNNVLRVPVYFNGLTNDPQSTSFNYDKEIIGIENANINVMSDFSNDTKTAVIIADATVRTDAPIAYLLLDKNTTELNATNVRFNGNDAEDVSFKLANSTELNSKYIANSPNPVTNNTTFDVNIPESGNYRVAIYDMKGNLVKTIANGFFNATSVQFNWNTADENGDMVSTGTYIYRLEGDNFSISNNLVIVR